jgi:hypothetical protein
MSFPIYYSLCFFNIYLSYWSHFWICCTWISTLQIPDVTIAEKKLHFSAEGYGAKGQHSYGFVLDLHSSLNPEVRYIMHLHAHILWRMWSVYHFSVCWLQDYTGCSRKTWQFSKEWDLKTVRILCHTCT